jgi:hypothetical protein
LGPATSAAEIEIQWPSGVRQVLKDVAVDREVRIKEAKP